MKFQINFRGCIIDGSNRFGIFVITTKRDTLIGYTSIKEALYAVEHKWG